jgi:H+/Na+-translocating ferredoxin:NAD+ oxidoreductase subunit D
MNNQLKFIVSHAPFWHDGSSITQRSYHIMIAALPAVLFGIFQYGLPALAVVSLSVSCAIFWELAMNLVSKRSLTIGDGNAALIGLLFAMLVPATLPWWAVLTGTFVAVIIGKEIFGGIGSNAFNPVVLTIAILMISWKDLFDFDEALLNYDFEFTMLYPIAALKHFGTASVDAFTAGDLLLGKQTGGIGATFGLGLIGGGLYLIIRGFIRWEICLTFLIAVFGTALAFSLYDGSRFAGPVFHALTGYTLIGAFFLATEDSSSPVNFIPMLIFGAGAGVLTVLIRNIGAHVDGVIYAILVMNLVNPVLDKIRPKAIGKVG